MTALAHIPLDRLRSIWPSLRQPIDAIAARLGEKFIADDVFGEIVAGRAMLWAADGVTAFVVLTVNVTAWSRTLNVWLAHNDSDDHVAAFVPQVRTIAREFNCTSIEFTSDREFRRVWPDARVQQVYFVENAGG